MKGFSENLIDLISQEGSLEYQINVIEKREAEKTEKALARKNKRFERLHAKKFEEGETEELNAIIDKLTQK